MGKNLFELREVQLSYKVKSQMDQQPLLTCSETTYKFLIEKCYDPETIEYRESVKVIFLTHKKMVLGVMNHTEGGMDSTMIDIRIIMQASLLSAATGIILSHNHPCDLLVPSRNDNMMTENLKSACKIMNISLIDHIIVSNNGYYSYSDEGML